MLNSLYVKSINVALDGNGSCVDLCEQFIKKNDKSSKTFADDNFARAIKCEATVDVCALLYN